MTRSVDAFRGSWHGPLREGEGPPLTDAELEAEQRRMGELVIWQPCPVPDLNSEWSSQLVFRPDVEGAIPPALSYAGDAGLDLSTSARTVIPAGQFRDVPCGVSVQLPIETWGLIKGRSSTLRKRGLLVNDAVIDNGYVGPLYVGVWNLGDVPVTVGERERIAQLVLCPVIRVPIRVVDSAAQLLSRDGRGTGGFGSTGG